MQFLNGDIRKELFNPESPIYTKTNQITVFLSKKTLSRWNSASAEENRKPIIYDVTTTTARFCLNAILNIGYIRNRNTSENMLVVLSERYSVIAMPESSDAMPGKSHSGITLFIFANSVLSFPEAP